LPGSDVGWVLIDVDITNHSILDSPLFRCRCRAIAAVVLSRVRGGVGRGEPRALRRLGV
jgi:hypothetical protein